MGMNAWKWDGFRTKNLSDCASACGTRTLVLRLFLDNFTVCCFTASNSSLKQSCLALTSVTSALEVIFNVMRSINPRFT